MYRADTVAFKITINHAFIKSVSYTNYIAFVQAIVLSHLPSIKYAFLIVVLCCVDNVI